ncbi:hypothetical protein F5880DRAFT_1542806 [Lentinula raphanica]|nr:hypothetical protein F5880DRAFT_1542806 [Lentinula raphanica]
MHLSRSALWVSFALCFAAGSVGASPVPSEQPNDIPMVDYWRNKVAYQDPKPERHYTMTLLDQEHKEVEVSKVTEAVLTNICGRALKEWYGGHEERIIKVKKPTGEVSKKPMNSFELKEDGSDGSESYIGRLAGDNPYVQKLWVMKDNAGLLKTLYYNQ